MLFGEAFHSRHKRFCHWVRLSRRSGLVATVTAEKTRDSALTLEPRRVDIEVHPFDALQLTGHMVIQDRSDALCTLISAPL
jgi:hypothetical protein